MDTSDPTSGQQRLHATCVAIENRALLLVGASGSGKSSVAIDLLSRGALLVGDDQVIVARKQDRIEARGIEGHSGMIEARGIGILAAQSIAAATVSFVVDMDQTELHRLPPPRKFDLLGLQLPLILGRENPGLVPGLWLLLSGRREK